MAMQYINGGKLSQEQMDQCKQLAAMMEQMAGPCPIGSGNAGQRGGGGWDLG